VVISSEVAAAAEPGNPAVAVGVQSKIQNQKSKIPSA
jgi:hypothetical protein